VVNVEGCKLPLLSSSSAPGPSWSSHPWPPNV
jgi:hypothetical protein